jgi:hypothetical protein
VTSKFRLEWLVRLSQPGAIRRNRVDIRSTVSGGRVVHFQVYFEQSASDLGSVDGCRSQKTS